MRTVPAKADQIPFLLARMGAEREAALQKICDGNAIGMIAQNISHSTYTWCGVDNDGIVTLGGILPAPDCGTGYLWQFVTDVASNLREYVRQQRVILAAGLEQYPYLRTIIEPEYPAAIRHMQRLGFAIAKPQEFDGKMGCVCERGRHV